MGRWEGSHSGWGLQVGEQGGGAGTQLVDCLSRELEALSSTPKLNKLRKSSRVVHTWSLSARGGRGVEEFKTFLSYTMSSRLT